MASSPSPSPPSASASASASASLLSPSSSLLLSPSPSLITVSSTHRMLFFPFPHVNPGQQLCGASPAPAPQLLVRSLSIPQVRRVGFAVGRTVGRSVGMGEAMGPHSSHALAQLLLMKPGFRRHSPMEAQFLQFGLRSTHSRSFCSLRSLPRDAGDVTLSSWRRLPSTALAARSADQRSFILRLFTKEH